MPLTTESASPQSKHWQLRQHAWISGALSLFLFVTFVGAIEITVRQEQLRDQTIATQKLIADTNEIHTLLEYELNSTLQLTTGLVSYIQSKHGVLVEQELNPWLTNLQERGKHIRNIGIAPNNRITYLYPKAGNEAALGLYYPDNKEQWPDVKKTILGRKPVLAGPIALRQGGHGLIYRVPVYLDDTGYWGLVSTVLNSDDLYSVIAERAKQLNISVAIKDMETGVSRQKALFGDSEVITQNVYETPLNIPGRDWRLLAKTNLHHDQHKLQNLRIAGWLIAVLLTILLFSFLRSIARQNLTLHALGESQYRFSQVFNTSPQGMALITHDGKWIDFNDSLCIALGYKRAQLQHLNLYQLLTLEQQLHIEKILHPDNFNTSPNNQYECMLLHNNGQYINVILSLAPVQPDAEDNSDWIMQFIDISHRVAVEKLLQEEAHYNQAILNSVVDGIMTIDRLGIIRSANPATEIIFDCDNDQLVNQHISHFVQEPFAGNIIKCIKSYTSNIDINNEINHDIIGLKINGSNFPMEIDMSCVQRKNEKIFIAVVRDISERKRLDRMKNEFISIVSHELRTPLTAILGSLRLLDSGALGRFAEQTEKMIHIAYKNGNKLSFLINDLLDMDKLLAGKMQFDFNVQPIYPLIVQAVENNSSYAAQYQIEFELIDPPGFAEVNVDGYRLQQVLSNLLSNAAKFSPPQAKVVISMHISTAHVRIEVRDQGTGISQEAQQHLFEKFYQVDSSSARQKNGTGLGLAISKELIESMHGHIGLTSQEGHGSCFYIELPLIKHNS